jgi:hypothetical protein
MADRITDGRTSLYVEDSPPTWIVAIACVAFLIFVGTAVGTAVVLLLQKFKMRNVGRHSMSARDLGNVTSVEEMEVIPKRRANQKII